MLDYEKRSQSLDPNFHKKGRKNGYILDKEIHTPGPATYKPQMKGVWGKSSTFKYRQILRDGILNKADKALKFGKKGSRSRTLRGSKTSQNSRSLNSKRARSRRGSKISKLTKGTYKTGRSKSIIGEDDLDESDEIIEQSVFKNGKNAAKSSKNSKSGKRRSISSHITEKMAPKLITPIEKKAVKFPRKSILMRRKSNFNAQKYNSNATTPNQSKIVGIKKQRKSVMIALPDSFHDKSGYNIANKPKSFSNLDSLENHFTPEKPRRKSILNRLNEENESIYESNQSGNSPLTLEKAKKERDQARGFIKNPSFKDPNAEKKALEVPKNKKSWKSLRNRRSSILKNKSRRGSKASISRKSIRSIYQEEHSEGKNQSSLHSGEKNIEIENAMGSQAKKAVPKLKKIPKNTSSLSPEKSNVKPVTTFGTAIRPCASSHLKNESARITKTKLYTDLLFSQQSKSKDSLIDLDNFGKEKDKAPVDLNAFAHKSKKSKPPPTPGPGDYYLEENTIIKDMDIGKTGPKLRPNLATKLLEAKALAEENGQTFKLSDANIQLIEGKHHLVNQQNKLYNHHGFVIKKPGDYADPPIDENLKVAFSKGHKPLGCNEQNKFTMAGRYDNYEIGGRANPKTFIPGPGAYNIFSHNALAADWDEEKEAQLFDSMMVNRKMLSNVGIRSNVNTEQDSKLQNWIEFQDKRNKVKRGILFPKAKRDLQVNLEKLKLARDPNFKNRCPGPADYNITQAVNFAGKKNPAYHIVERRGMYIETLGKDKKSKNLKKLNRLILFLDHPGPGHYYIERFGDDTNEEHEYQRGFYSSENFYPGDQSKKKFQKVSKKN